jgi:hypothetical protein
LKRHELRAAGHGLTGILGVAGIGERDFAEEKQRTFAGHDAPAFIALGTEIGEHEEQEPTGMSGLSVAAVDNAVDSIT